MPSKKYHVDLTENERKYLRTTIQKRSTKSQITKRAFILLAADRNGDKIWGDQQIASTYGVRQTTVENVRKRFIVEGFENTLHGKPKEYIPEKVITGDVEAHLVALRCSDPPSGYSQWTCRLLADKMVELSYVEKISHESVRQVLKKRNKALAGKKLGNT